MSFFRSVFCIQIFLLFIAAPFFISCHIRAYEADNASSVNGGVEVRRMRVGRAQEYAAYYDCKASSQERDSQHYINKFDPFMPRESRESFQDSLVGSMSLRRQYGWCLFEKIFHAAVESKERVLDIPVFLTWYDPEEIIGLFRSIYQKKRLIAPAEKFPIFEKSDILAAMEAATTSRVNKKRSHTLFKGTLLQNFLAPGLESANFNGIPASGFNLYSPSMVVRLLMNYKSILECPIHKDKSIPEVFKFPAVTNPENFSAPCLTKEFPADSAMVKSVWIPVTQPNPQPIPVYSTSAEAMNRLFSNSHADWSIVEVSKVVPKPSNMIVETDEDGHMWGLVALHISTKEVREWLWSTIWWAPPTDKSGNHKKKFPYGSNLDFGSDRPDFNRLSDGANYRLIYYADKLTNYKMCIVPDFIEKQSAWKEYEGQPAMRSLLEALNASDKGVNLVPKGKQSVGERAGWCSNPYVEFHRGNSHTNCIGCHQHAGTGIDFNKTIQLTGNADEHRHFPKYGGTKLRDTFPADFAWGYELRFRPGFKDVIDKIITPESLNKPL